MTKELHTAEETRAHFRSVIPILTNCVICLNNIDSQESDRGIIEFYDGWFWICSKCRELLKDKLLDMTQSDDWGKQEVIPYSKSSRKRWLQWLQKEHSITLLG